MKLRSVIAAGVFALAIPMTASAGTFVFTGPYVNQPAQLFNFTTNGVDLVTITTHGSPNTPSGYQLDSQLFVIAPGGYVVADNDDADGKLTSRIGPESAPAGSWILALTLFNVDPILNGGGQVVGWTQPYVQFPYNGEYKLTFSGVDSAAPVPEPATLTLLATGAAGLVRRQYRKRRQTV